jgi:tetratricopeptide (TPR) repeat protein
MTGGGTEASGARSVAAETIGVAITGDGARVVMLPPEATRRAQDVSAPPGATNLPGSASGVFYGREQELTRLRELLAREGEAAVTQPRSGTWAIHGLGGIGKSALALRYAHAYRHTYTAVWWIPAESGDRIIAGLASLAAWLCPQWAGTADVDERAGWAILWLQWHPGWLLVFDNVENPADLRHYLGALPGGHHLATSRKSVWWQSIAPAMPLGLLDPEASVDLLCALASGQERAAGPEERRHAAELAEELGHLPLALEQAGAYMLQTGTDLRTYRALLGQALDAAADGIDPQRTIARVWNHTLTAIESRDPLALVLLYTLAWLAPDGVPRALLAPLAPDPKAQREAAGVLHAYNMVAFTADRREVTVHRLVQAVLRSRVADEPDIWAVGRGAAEEAVVRAVPDEDDDTADHEGRWERMLPHVFALVETAPADSPVPAPVADAYHSAAQYLYRQGRNAHTVRLREAVLTRYEEDYGPTHRLTLNVRNSLAEACESAGDLARAIPLFESTLALTERVLGDTHRDTLTGRNNLASAYESAGDLARAIPLFESTLALTERVLGESDPNTLTGRNNLASAYESAGDFARAIPLLEATLAERERLLGESDPDTLTSCNNLANAYQAMGNPARAIALHEVTLARSERVFGVNHPATLTSRNNLAVAYETAGDRERAMPLYEATLAQREQLLGATHPATLTSLNNLAVAYESAGEFDRAIPLYETTVAQCEQALGPDHPSTLVSRSNRARAYGAAGDLERAITSFETTLARAERVLGPAHPATLTVSHNLAVVYRDAGDLERAITLYETTLDRAERVLGESHSDTLSCRRSLAYAYEAAGMHERAVPLYEATLAVQERTLGPSHSDTLGTRDDLVEARRAARTVRRAGQPPPPAAGPGAPAN